MDLEGRHDWGLKDKNVGRRHELEGNTKEEGNRLMERMSGRITNSWAAVFKCLPCHDWRIAAGC